MTMGSEKTHRATLEQNREPPERARSPLLVATIGLHGSASTWVFNVARELLISHFGEASVLTYYADQIGQIPDDAARAGRHLIIKSHHGSPALDDWLRKAGARIVLSIRDPRDASISMAQRFKAPLLRATQWLQNDCHRVMRVVQNSSLLLRYEERFFEKPESVLRLTDAIGIEPKKEDIGPIFARYRTAAVREFAASLASLPPERLTKVGPFAMDTVTQILAPHIGDTRSEKWRELSQTTQRLTTAHFQSFIEAMGYPLD